MVIQNFPRWRPAAILDSVKPEIAPFDPPSPKPYPKIKHKVDWTTRSRDMAIWNFPRWRPGAILDLVQPEIAPFDPPISKTLPENHTWSGSDDPLPRYGQNVRSVCLWVGRSVIGPQYIHCSHILLFATLGTSHARSKNGLFNFYCWILHESLQHCFGPSSNIVLFSSLWNTSICCHSIHSFIYLYQTNCHKCAVVTARVRFSLS